MEEEIANGIDQLIGKGFSRAQSVKIYFRDNPDKKYDPRASYNVATPASLSPLVPQEEAKSEDPGSEVPLARTLSHTGSGHKLDKTGKSKSDISIDGIAGVETKGMQGDSKDSDDDYGQDIQEFDPNEVVLTGSDEKEISWLAAKGYNREQAIAIIHKRKYPGKTTNEAAEPSALRSVLATALASPVKEEFEAEKNSRAHSRTNSGQTPVVQSRGHVRTYSGQAPAVHSQGQHSRSSSGQISLSDDPADEQTKIESLMGKGYTLEQAVRIVSAQRDEESSRHATVEDRSQHGSSKTPSGKLNDPNRTPLPPRPPVALLDENGEPVSRRTFHEKRLSRANSFVDEEQPAPQTSPVVKGETMSRRAFHEKRLAKSNSFVEEAQPPAAHAPLLHGESRRAFHERQLSRTNSFVDQPPSPQPGPSGNEQTFTDEFDEAEIVQLILSGHTAENAIKILQGRRQGSRVSQSFPQNSDPPAIAQLMREGYTHESAWRVYLQNQGIEDAPASSKQVLKRGNSGIMEVPATTSYAVGHTHRDGSRNPSNPGSRQHTPQRSRNSSFNSHATPIAEWNGGVRSHSRQPSYSTQIEFHDIITELNEREEIEVERLMGRGFTREQAVHSIKSRPPPQQAAVVQAPTQSFSRNTSQEIRSTPQRHTSHHEFSHHEFSTPAPAPVYAANVMPVASKSNSGSFMYTNAQYASNSHSGDRSFDEKDQETEIELLISSGYTRDQAVQVYSERHQYKRHNSGNVVNDVQTQHMLRRTGSIVVSSAETSPIPAGSGMGTAKKSADEVALKVAMIVSQQESEFGMTMYDAMSVEDEEDIEELKSLGYTADDAILLIFEKRFRGIPYSLTSPAYAPEQYRRVPSYLPPRKQVVQMTPTKSFTEVEQSPPAINQQQNSPPVAVKPEKKKSFLKSMSFRTRDSESEAKKILRYKDADVKVLMAMGFSKDQAVQALIENNNNVQMAANVLLSN